MPLRIEQNKDRSILLFYQKSCLFSNFYPVRFRVKIEDAMVEFNCSEQYFMYQKALLAGDPDTAKKILEMTAPLSMKQAGRQLAMSTEMLKFWSDKSSDVMYDGCLQKFSQDETCRLSLLRTQGMLLAEASPRDRLWGIGVGVNDPRARNPKSWNGQNKLGKILEKVRDSIWNQEEFRKDRELVEKEDAEKRWLELRNLK